MDEEEIREKREQLEYEKRRAMRRAKRKKKHRQEMIFKIVMGIFLIIILAVTVTEVRRLVKSMKTEPVEKEIAVQKKKIVQTPPDYDVQLLDINEYSRPGTALEKVKGIVVHYTANPGTSAQNNRDYFEGLSESKETYASSHFVIGIEGELIQCIPCNEISYASNDRNNDTISIECCIPEESSESGKFTEKTYQTLVHLTAWLMGRYDLDTEDVIRHYDVTGKNCPKYFVENEGAWLQFKKDIDTYIETYGTEEGSGDSETDTSV